jgi:DNA-directed RNA polymerase subunit RPC12/RpoP
MRILDHQPVAERVPASSPITSSGAVETRSGDVSHRPQSCHPHVDRGGWPIALAVMIEPAPMKTSANVPTNSAAVRRKESSTRRSVRSAPVVAPNRSGTFAEMSSAPESPASYELVCPHCRRQISAELIDDAAARYRDVKCPHCRLFVPVERADEPTPAEYDA